MFAPQFYFDCRYMEGLTEKIPRWELFGMWSCLEPNSEPTQHETAEMMAKLAAEFGGARSAAIVTALYQQVVLLENGKGRLRELGQACEVLYAAAPLPDPVTPPHTAILSQIELLEHNITLAQNLLATHPHARFVCSPVHAKQGERRDEQRRSVAFALADNKYGHHAFMESQRSRGRRDLMNPTTYALLARSVVADAYRTIERYLQKIIPLVPLTREQLALALDHLLRCKTTMQPDDALSFLRVVKMAFGFSSPLIHQESAAYIYFAVQCHIKRQLEQQEIRQFYTKRKEEPVETENNHQEETERLEVEADAVEEEELREKREEKEEKEEKEEEDESIESEQGQSGEYMPRKRGLEGDSRRGPESNSRACRSLQKIWNPELQAKMVGFFKEDCDYGRMRTHLLRAFPQHRRYFTMIALRAQTHKLLRIAIRTLRGYLTAMGKNAPPMVPMTDKRIKYFLLAQSNELVGQDLIRFITEPLTPASLHAIVKAINSFIAAKESQLVQRRTALTLKRNGKPSGEGSSSSEFSPMTESVERPAQAQNAEMKGELTTNDLEVEQERVEGQTE